MTRIPTHDRDIFEQALYLPMLLTIMERDKQIFGQIDVKIKEPYLGLIEASMKAVQLDLKVARDYMRNNNMKIAEIKRDEDFTMFSFLYKGYDEHHNYFNHRLRNKCKELLTHYLFNHHEMNHKMSK
ncbi:hypothetical protein [Peribacillus sp. SCS-155]|uniref:hypothetical protein n=1 Tax=Peribacillus sedimenti TaxID=3115297 RepID=UPI0039057E8E